MALPEIGDRVCDLECLKNASGGVHEFVGPVKIVLTETSPGEYTRRQWVAAFVMAAYYMMGVINVTAMYYTLLWWRTLHNHFHVILCTSSLMFLTPTAVLFYNPWSGTGAAMRPKDRDCAHMVLQIVSALFLSGGIYAILTERNLNLDYFSNLHTQASLAAIVGTGINLVFGMITFTIRWSLFKCIHRLIGVLTLIACGASFVTGMFEIKPLFSFKLPFSFIPFLSPIMGMMSFPMTIRIIERKHYCRSIWCAVGIGLCHLMIGATNIVALLYTVKKGDPHVALCCFTFHLFSVQAILALNYANFLAIAMRAQHRIMAHIIMQLIALVFGCVGTVLICIERGASVSLHFISSAIAIGLALLSLILGIFALSKSYYGRPVHVTFGMLTFILASLSLISGITTDTFMKTVDPVIVYILIGFIVFYTAFICISALIKCVSKI